MKFPVEAVMRSGKTVNQAVKRLREEGGESQEVQLSYRQRRDC